MTDRHGSVREHAAKACTARLATRITAGVDTRPRKLALIRRQRASRLPGELLDVALPGTAELAARMANLGQDGDTSGDGDDG